MRPRCARSWARHSRANSRIDCSRYWMTTIGVACVVHSTGVPFDEQLSPPARKNAPNANASTMKTISIAAMPPSTNLNPKRNGPGGRAVSSSTAR